MSNRTEILRALEEVGRQHPDMRFGQLVCMLAHQARGVARSATYDVEDLELLAAAREHLGSCPKCRGNESEATGPDRVARPKRAAAIRSGS